MKIPTLWLGCAVLSLASCAEVSAANAHAPSSAGKEAAQANMEKALETYCIRARNDNDVSVHDGLHRLVDSLEANRVHIQDAQKQYQRARSQYVQANPAILISTKTFTVYGQIFVTADAIKTCDAWHGEALEQIDELIAKVEGRAVARAKQPAEAEKGAREIQTGPPAGFCAAQ